MLGYVPCTDDESGDAGDIFRLGRVPGVNPRKWIELRMGVDETADIYAILIDVPVVEHNRGGGARRPARHRPNIYCQSIVSTGTSSAGRCVFSAEGRYPGTFATVEWNVVQEWRSRRRRNALRDIVVSRPVPVRSRSSASTYSLIASQRDTR